MVLYFWEKQSLLATNSTNTTAAFSFNNINNLLTSIISLVLSVVYQQSLVSHVVRRCLMYVFCLYLACLMVFLWQLFLFSLNRLALELTKCHLGDQEHFFRSGEIAPLGGGTVGGQPQPQGRRGRVTLTVVKDVLCLFKLCMNMILISYYKL